MVLDYRLDDGAQALDQQQEIDWKRGWQVIGAASGSNTVSPPSGGGVAVDIASGDVNAGGSTVSCSAVTDFSLPAADPSSPRTDVVYRDSNGDPQYKQGATATVEPTGAEDRTAAAPPPYPMHDIDGVVLATVYVRPGASAVTADDIRDRRMPADLALGDDLQIATDQSIEDGTGTNRFDLLSDRTNVVDENGNSRIAVADGFGNDVQLLTNSGLLIKDQNGGFDGIKYLTSSSTPGTLELTNANLDANSNDITNVQSLSTETTKTTGYQWQNVTGSRSLGTWETAPSDRDIWFAANIIIDSGPALAQLIPNVNTSQSQNRLVGTKISDLSTGDEIGIGPVKVPAGQHYRVEQFGDTSSFSIDIWSELR